MRAFSEYSFKTGHGHLAEVVFSARMLDFGRDRAPEAYVQAKNTVAILVSDLCKRLTVVNCRVQMRSDVAYMVGRIEGWCQDVDDAQAAILDKCPAAEGQVSRPYHEVEAMAAPAYIPPPYEPSLHWGTPGYPGCGYHKGPYYPNEASYGDPTKTVVED